MVLVEPKAFEVMKTNSHRKTPLQNALSEVGEKMNKILSQSDIPTTKKVKLLVYSQVLKRYMVYKNKLENTSEKVHLEEKKNFSENEILNHLPSQHTSKAKELVNFIKDNSSIGWSNTGELKFDNKTIPNTSIKDLVYAASQKETQQSKPHGWELFQGVLSALQAPTQSKTQQKKNTTKIIETFEMGTLQVTYYDTKNPGSFGGVEKLERATGQPVKDWLITQNTYTLHKPIRRHFC